MGGYPPSGVEVQNLYFDRTPRSSLPGSCWRRASVEPYQIRKIARSMVPFSAYDDRSVSMRKVPDCPASLR
jgi:hypothetical protein